MGCSPPGSSLSVRLPRQENWSGLPFPSLGDLLDPAIEPESPALAGGFFTFEPSGKPLRSEEACKHSHRHVASKLCFRTWCQQSLWQENWTLRYWRREASRSSRETQKDEKELRAEGVKDFYILDWGEGTCQASPGDETDRCCTSTKTLTRRWYTAEVLNTNFTLNSWLLKFIHAVACGMVLSFPVLQSSAHISVGYISRSGIDGWE